MHVRLSKTDLFFTKPMQVYFEYRLQTSLSFAVEEYVYKLIGVQSILSWL